MYDAIIVGARVAGSPLAMLLARKGYRVLLLDKARFPSDTISTHHIHQPGVARLKRWGLLGRIQASNVPPTTEIRFDVGPFALKGTPPPADGVAEAYAPRRKVLDKILADAAAEAGAELREGFSVEEVTTEGGVVTGVRGRDAKGSRVTERARVVVGADGARSSRAWSRRPSTSTAGCSPATTTPTGAACRSKASSSTRARGAWWWPTRPTTG